MLGLKLKHDRRLTKPYGLKTLNMKNQEPIFDPTSDDRQETLRRRQLLLGLSMAPMVAMLPGCGGSEPEEQMNETATAQVLGDSADAERDDTETADVDDDTESPEASANILAASTPIRVQFTDVSVHDPSVIRVGSTWYVFGSHLAAAKTNDLMNWQMVAGGVNNANRLFNNVTKTLSEVFAWSRSSTLWAPDVSQLPDGRFAFYYNACQGDSPRSAIGLAISNGIEGPYQNQGIFLKSGMTGQISEDRVNVYNPSIHPNAVDPQAFVDASGNKWLLYGSYSGGLFILKLDKATGLPVPGQGYGKHLVGGNHARIEGGYILYSPQVQWYYLFMSFGGLDSTGGYNIRVARSRRPDGPYVDGLGQAMASCKADPRKPVFDDVTIAPYGQKLMGCHQFSLARGETGPAQGYVSPGHNSAYYDEKKKQHLLFFHARFPGMGDVHQVRVHTFDINAEEWPVVAPLRYVPLSKSPTKLLKSVARAEVPGTYKLVNHGKDISATIKTSRTITLQSDDTLSGGFAGRWSHDRKNRISFMTANGTVYYGMLSRQWNPNTGTFVVCFSAQSNSGVSLWGIRTA